MSRIRQHRRTLVLFQLEVSLLGAFLWGCGGYDETEASNTLPAPQGEFQKGEDRKTAEKKGPFGVMRQALSPATCSSTEWTTIPAMISSGDFPLDINNTAIYANNVDHIRRLYFSRNVTDARFRFQNLFVEEDFDYVKFSDFSIWFVLTGEYPPNTWVGVFVPALFYGQKVMRFWWFSDYSVSETGFTMDQVQVKCSGSGSAESGIAEAYNEPVDGFLVGTGDTIFFSVYLPANDRMNIHLQSPAGTWLHDFDVYAKAGPDWPPVLPGPGNYDWRGYNGVANDEMIPEFVEISPASPSNRRIWFAITSYYGAGHFRFRANVVTQWNNSLNDVHTDWSPSAAELDKIKAQITAYTKGVYEATDGEVFLKYWEIWKNVSCYNRCDVLYEEDYDTNPNASGWCYGSEPEHGRGGVITFDDWGYDHFDPNNVQYGDKYVRAFFEHEGGHCLFGFDEEYCKGPPACEDALKGRARCGHSTMAGWDTLYANVWDYCTSWNHGKDPRTGVTAMDGASNWDVLYNTNNRTDWRILFKRTNTPDPYTYDDTDFLSHLVFTIHQ